MFGGHTPPESRIAGMLRVQCGCLQMKVGIEPTAMEFNFKLHLDGLLSGLVLKIDAPISTQYQYVPHKAVAEVSKIGNL